MIMLQHRPFACMRFHEILFARAQGSEGFRRRWILAQPIQDVLWTNCVLLIPLILSNGCLDDRKKCRGNFTDQSELDTRDMSTKTDHPFRPMNRVGRQGASRIASFIEALTNELCRSGRAEGKRERRKNFYSLLGELYPHHQQS